MKFALVPAFVALLLASCGNDGELPPMIDGNTVDHERAEALFAQAQEADDAGKNARAIKLYDELADEIPLARKAPDARFRQAQLLEEQGETQKAFDAYQDLLTRYQGSGYYRQALDRQAEVAFAAADGDIRNNFLGLKSKLSSDKIITMLESVVGNAPRSRLAARAEKKIGDIHAEKKDVPKAVAAYRSVVETYPDSPEAPEAQFAIGKILLDQAQDGNQDQANLDRASDAFQDYLSQFPGHSRNEEARQLISSLRGRDLQNTYDIAAFYEKKGDAASARFYYEEVMRRQKSGDLHDKAAARLAALPN